MNILEEANSLTAGDRQDDYGHPAEDFQKVVDMAKGLGLVPETFNVYDHCLYMVLVKLAREVNKPKRDNLVDGAGYFRTLEMCREYHDINRAKAETLSANIADFNFTD